MKLPWSAQIGKSIDDYHENELKEMFQPWDATFSARKKHGFVSDFFEQGVPKDAQILDIGCGVGMLSRQLATLGYENITAMDPDEDAISNAKRLSNESSLKVDYKQIGFGVGVVKDKYDVVWMDSVLEHVEEYSDWIGELSKITNPGGYVFIIVPSIYGGFSLMNDIDYKKLKWKPQPYNMHPLMHCNHFTLRQLKREFSDQGLDLFQTYKFQLFNPVIKFLLKKMGLYRLYPSYTRLDYYFSKVFPSDISTRILVFRKEL